MSCRESEIDVARSGLESERIKVGSISSRLIKELSSTAMDSDYVKSFVEKLTKDPSVFLQKYKDGLLKFFLDGKLEDVLTYVKKCNSSGQNNSSTSVLLAAKAEIMGKFSEFKFHGNSISEEIEKNVSEDLKSLWKENISYKNCTEDESFETSFYVGVRPSRTCQAFDDGSYKECLPSFFDSTKKLIVYKDESRVRARCILRLTKRILSTEAKTIKPVFVDLENVGELVDHNISSEESELCVFCERCYGDDVYFPEMLSLAYRKAKKMGLNLYATGRHGNKLFEKNGLTGSEKTVKLFINHSKNGKQYIDFMGGRGDDSTSGGTYSGVFYEVNTQKKEEEMTP